MAALRVEADVSFPIAASRGAATVCQLLRDAAEMTTADPHPDITGPNEVDATGKSMPRSKSYGSRLNVPCYSTRSPPPIEHALLAGSIASIVNGVWIRFGNLEWP